ncbi:NAD(P)H-binding protein [uncultured Maribacter sp.]|uniref:NmrA family NAD(P)-binding protein n=1 Tax=uncultured Maribacter sp. TaxID=431308 RepID=UPI002609D032|nr:NAD(P)H-binding protein [uncultured Maribacter sp.]
MKDINQKVLLTGAECILGGVIVRRLAARNVPVKVLTRNLVGKHKIPKSNGIVVEKMSDQPNLLAKHLEGINTVISTLSLVRENRSIFDICSDYQANIQLLYEMKKAGIKKFVYVEAPHSYLHNNPKIIEEKNFFLLKLKESKIEYTVISTNGTFSNFNSFLMMANKGRIYLFGKGNEKFNPIDIKDLARACIEAITIKHNHLCVGGPEILTIKEIAKIAFDAHGKHPQIIHIPSCLKKIILWAVYKFNTRNNLPCLNYMQNQVLGIKYGNFRLSAFFKNEANTLKR